MTVDEILADPSGALELPTDAVPTRIVIIAEYYEPGADTEPQRPRLSVTTDDANPPWTVIGMLRFCEQQEMACVEDWHDEEEEEG